MMSPKAKKIKIKRKLDRNQCISRLVVKEADGHVDFGVFDHDGDVHGVEGSVLECSELRTDADLDALTRLN